MTKRHKRRATPRIDRAQSLEQVVAFREGIDVSHHQGAIDWARVAAAGIQYCFIKATEGAVRVDPRFAANWRGAHDHKIKRGAYHFFSPAVAVQQQVKKFTDTVTLEVGDLAPVLDLEIDGQNWSGVPQDQRVPRALEMLEALESHYQMKPFVYTNKRTVNEVFARKPGKLATYPLWVASYKNAPPPTMPPGWSDWAIWQYTDKGSVAGISTPVDRNRSITIPPIKGVERELMFAESLQAPPRFPMPDHVPSPLEVFEQLWSRVQASQSRMFPDGLTRADINLDISPAGDMSISITLSGVAEERQKTRRSIDKD